MALPLHEGGIPMPFINSLLDLGLEKRLIFCLFSTLHKKSEKGYGLNQILFFYQETSSAISPSVTFFS